MMRSNEDVTMTAAAVFVSFRFSFHIANKSQYIIFKRIGDKGGPSSFIPVLTQFYCFVFFSSSLLWLWNSLVVGSFNPLRRISSYFCLLLLRHWKQSNFFDLWFPAEPFVDTFATYWLEATAIIMTIWKQRTNQIQINFSLFVRSSSFQVLLSLWHYVMDATQLKEQRKKTHTQNKRTPSKKKWNL